MNNWLGLGLSYVFVFLVIGISTFLQKTKVLSDEGARKFIHIGVSNWWILAALTFDNVWFAIIPPISFIILNYVSYRLNLIKAMERNGSGNLGTVYFPIALLILVIFCFGIYSDQVDGKVIGGVGILILGYGDGFAAVFGKKYGQKRLINGKSLVGTVTMFIVSFLVMFIGGYIAFSFSHITVILIAFMIASIATLVELVTPKGFDNLTVPLLTSFVFMIILQLI